MYGIDGLVQDCGNSIANALELLHFCSKPSIWCGHDKIYIPISEYLLGNISRVI